MFTGLIADLGEVVDVERSADGVRLTVHSHLAGELSEGDSVAVNGVCLTATAIDGPAARFRAEVVNETLRLTALGEASAGEDGQTFPVNLELAVRAGDRMGGHIVQGHVDGMGTVASVVADGFGRRVTIEADPDLLRYVVHKGSITVDGISLTVAGLGEASFSVALIPETLQRTTLGSAESGTPVNLEVDVLAKYVEKLVIR